LKNVGEAGKTRQKQPKKRNLHAVNEHFEAVFNAVLPTQVVFQRSAGLDAGHGSSYRGDQSQTVGRAAVIVLAARPIGRVFHSSL
jgi:hypothetical protein